jgi:hypothetical protein
VIIGVGAARLRAGLFFQKILRILDTGDQLCSFATMDTQCGKGKSDARLFRFMAYKAPRDHSGFVRSLSIRLVYLLLQPLLGQASSDQLLTKQGVTLHSPKAPLHGRSFRRRGFANTQPIGPLNHFDLWFATQSITSTTPTIPHPMEQKDESDLSDFQCSSGR